MANPKLYGPTLRFDKSFRRAGPEFTYAMRTGAPLMAGWTVLLIWADRKPLERRGVLPITVLPVIAGLMANDADAVRVGRLSGRSVVPVRALQLGLIGLFGYSLARARAANLHGRLNTRAQGSEKRAEEHRLEATSGATAVGVTAAR
jgi:hypothetical protein